MNLINDSFLPVRRESGKREKIAPYQITEREDPILSLDAPRPDFNGALMQFMIGLLQTAAMPEDEDRWLKRLEEPPPPEELKERFGQYAHAFETEGNKGAFMQDLDPLEDGKEEKIFRLLIDSPGAATVKDNKDHFVKESRAQNFCESCAAIALFTLQANAPSGGQGHRTSMRGGGPLTTLAVIDAKSDGDDKRLLWQNLWLNVLDSGKFGGDHDRNTKHPNIFPWLAESRTSEKGETIAPANASLLQMYWGMPRRIRIQWGSSESGICDLCGEEAPRLIKNYKTKSHGINYEAWRHHLSPYYEKKGAWLPRHLKEGAVSYQHWLDYVKEAEKSRPAKVIRRYRKLAKDWKEQFLLRAFGYEMDNMKARCYYDKEFPLFSIDENMREDFFQRVGAMTEASTLCAKHLSKSVKDAWFKKANSSAKTMPSLKKTFYQKTEEGFFRLLKELARKIKNQAGKEVLHDWHTILHKSALGLFDYWAGTGDIAFSDPKRIVQARQYLKKNIFGKKIKDILQLPADSKRKRK